MGGWSVREVVVEVHAEYGWMFMGWREVCVYERVSE